MRLRIATAIFLAASVGACAIHPLPEDVTGGVTTEVIVGRVRCEARLGIINAFLSYLRGDTEDEGARELADFLTQRDTRGWGSDIARFDTQNRTRRSNFSTTYYNFTGGAIAYDFTFDMTEINDIDPTLKAAKPMKAGTRIFGLTVTADRTRHAIRDFSITDRFIELLALSDDDCAGKVVSPNFVYPIVGEIGLKEMTNTFVTLWLKDKVKFASQAAKAAAALNVKMTALNRTIQDLDVRKDPLAAHADDAKIKARRDSLESKLATTTMAYNAAAAAASKSATPQASKASAVITDTFEFTTNWSTTITPELQISAIRHLLRVSDAALPFTNSRKDVHKVIVGLATSDAADNVQNTANFLSSRSLPSNAEQAAANAVANHILRFEVLPRAAILP